MLRREFGQSSDSSYFSGIAQLHGCAELAERTGSASSLYFHKILFCHYFIKNTLQQKNQILPKSWYDELIRYYSYVPLIKTPHFTPLILSFLVFLD